MADREGEGEGCIPTGYSKFSTSLLNLLTNYMGVSKFVITIVTTRSDF